MEITIENIPQYLKNSQLFKSLEENSEDQNDIIVVNPNHIRKDITLNSFNDVFIYLDIIRYWGIHDFDDDLDKDILYDYVVDNQNIDINNLKMNFPELIDIIERMEHTKNLDEDSFIYAVQKDDIYFFEYLLSINNSSMGIKLAHYIIKNNNLKFLKYISDEYSLSSMIDIIPGKNICTFAAGEGSLECLQYLIKNEYQYKSNAFEIAALNGHLDCLKYLYQKDSFDINIDKCKSNALLNGHTDCIIFLNELEDNEF